MITPALKSALLNLGNLDSARISLVMKDHSKDVSLQDIPEILDILKKQPESIAFRAINGIAGSSSIPKIDFARALYQEHPSIPNYYSLDGLFGKMSKEDFDQLSDEGVVFSSPNGLTLYDGIRQSPKYASNAIAKSIDNLGADNPYELFEATNELDSLFSGEKGGVIPNEQQKQNMSDAFVRYMKRYKGYGSVSVGHLAPIYAHLLKNSPEEIKNIHDRHLPAVDTTQDLVDAAIHHSKSPNANPELIDWAINKARRTSPSGIPLGFSMHGDGETVFDILNDNGFYTGNVLDTKDHGVSFQKLKKVKGTANPSAFRYASYLDGDEEALYDLFGKPIDEQNEKNGVVRDPNMASDGIDRLLSIDSGKKRTPLTAAIERIAEKHGGLGASILLRKGIKKHRLSDSDQEKIGNYLSVGHNMVAHAPIISDILQMESLKPSVVSRIMRSVADNIKGSKHVVEGVGIPFGSNHFADRSVSSEGHYTGDDPSLHPNDVLDVRVGSSVLRKLRDHLEKAGQIRPEDLPKGESWNSILKPITDKSGNVNYIPDWNPLRSANGKLDSAKVQQYIDSMPARRFVLSYSTWTHPLQRHSKAKSNVLIANLSPDTIEKLKQENLYGKFLEKTVGDVNTIHPLGRDSIGWIRFTGDHKKGFHVDEVQSDLYGDLRKSTDPDHKRIAEIVFGDAHPSEILHEVAQEYFRKNPKNIGAPWATHTVASKSPMALEEAKEAPVHFKVSYEQAPKRMGAKPSTYGTLRTQTGDNPKYAAKYALQGKPTWQDEVRKFEEVEGEDLLVKATAKKTKTPAPEASPSVQKEPKDLVVLHNLREAGLHHADEIGGLPAPSIAVAKVDHPLTNFGDVSLVGHHSMIDPKDTPVFDADVYSPRWPRVGHTLDSKKLSQFHLQMGPLNKEIGGFGINDDEIEKSGENAIDSRGIRYPLALAFIREQGHDFKPHTKDKANLSGHEYLNTPIVHQFFKENKIPMDVYGWKHEVPHLAEEFKKILPTAIRQMYGKLDDGKLDAATKSALEQKINEAIDDLKEYAIDETKDGIGGLDYNYLRAITHLYPNIGKTEPDGYKNQDALDQKIKEIGEEKFSEWAKSKIRPLIKDKHIIRFTKSGTKKKLPYTLVNLLNELTSTIRGGEKFNYGLGTARSHGATQFKDLSHMANSRHKIVSNQDFTKQKIDMYDRFNTIANVIYGTASTATGFHVMDNLAEAIGSYYRNKQMGRSLSSAGFSGVPASVVNQIKQFADDLRNMPTEYFEAKPQRIVDLSEFKGAAVPHDASEKTLEILRRNGINHIERYDRDNEDARREAIRRIAQGNDLLLNETEYANLIKSFAKNEVKKAFKHEVSEGILSQSKQLVKSEDRKMVIRKAIVTTFQKLQKAIAKQMLYPEKDPVVLDDLLRIKTLGHKTPEHALDSFVQHEEPEVRISAIHELPLKDHHLHTLVHDADPEVAKQAVRSSKAQEAHLLAALERPDHDLHALVAMHPNATENTLHKVLDGEHPLDVKLAAVQNPKNDLPALMGAARRYTEATDDSPEAEILTEILSHPHADQPLYQSVLHGNFPSTAKAIAASKLIDDTHLANALTHPDELVALGAVASPKARSGHYHHANSDSVKKAIAMKFGGAV